MARTRDQVLASARAFMADCKPLQYDCEPGVFVNGRRRHLDQDDDPEDGRDYPSAEGSQQYATARAKAGLPVKMKLGKINNLPGQSFYPSFDLRLSASAAGYAGNKGSGFFGSRPVPRTLQEQKDLVKLIAKGGLKDVYPSGDNPVRDNGFGYMKRGEMHTFDPAAMAVAADRLEERGHTLAAKLARWRAATGDPENFGHLWTKEHQDEHAAGYAAKPGGVQSYATARAKAGLPVEMNLSGLSARMVKAVPWGRMQGDDYPGRSASAISPIPRKDLRESAEKFYSTPVDPKNPPLIGVPFPRTLAEQKSLVKAMAKGEFADVYPWTSGTYGFGETEGVGKNSIFRRIAANPAELAIASDRLEERGHTLAARVARWRAAKEDPKNFGHLWTRQHAEEHAAGYAANPGGVQQYGLRDSLKKAARAVVAGAAVAGGGAAGMNAGNLVLPTATWMGHPIAVAAGKGPQFVDRSIDTLEKMQQMHESSPAFVQKTAKVITKPVSSMEDTVDMFRLGTGMPVSQLHTPHNFGPIIAGGAAGAGLAAGLLARRRSRKGPGTYAASGDAIAGGVADNRDADEFDREDVAEGSREEMEHTRDPGIAQEIARDHLAEDPEYYRKLRKAGLTEYATERAKAGLPVKMNLSDEKISNIPGQSFLPVGDLRLSASGGRRLYPGMPAPRTLQEQKDLVKLVAKGGLRDVYPSGEHPLSDFGVGELRSGFFDFDPPAMAVASDRLEERGHTLAAKIARWRAATEDPENFGHLWTKEHQDEHAAGYAAKPGGVQQYGLRDSLKKAARTVVAGAAVAGGGVAGMNAGNMALPTATLIGHPLAVEAGKGQQFVDGSLRIRKGMKELYRHVLPKTSKLVIDSGAAPSGWVAEQERKLGPVTTAFHTPIEPENNTIPIIAGGASGAGLAAGLLARRRAKKGAAGYAASMSENQRDGMSVQYAADLVCGM